MSHLITFKEKLLPLLCCPQCHSQSALKLVPGTTQVENSQIKQHDEHLVCQDCSQAYPITEDFIPIMWTQSLKEIFNGVNTDSNSNLAANMEIYDAISDNYHLFTRQSMMIAHRMKNAVKKILGKGESGLGKIHLDFGCGPGHVLGWLKEFNFTQIGMDVSLINLRNARKNTNCLVICGDACAMPLRDHAVDMVTESSVLHHIQDWKMAVKESVRVSKLTGGIVLDSEPSQKQMAWSPLAVAVFNFRFVVYKILSYFMHDKYIFRNTQQAKLNLMAEIHHQPGTGFPVNEIDQLFKTAGFEAEIISSPTEDLHSEAKPGWKGVVLNFLSAKNPWNPDYGPFLAIAMPQRVRSSYRTPLKQR